MVSELNYFNEKRPNLNELLIKTIQKQTKKIHKDQHFQSLDNQKMGK